MKKTNKALMGILTLMGSMPPLYADDIEPSIINPGKSSFKAPCGWKTSSDIISNQRFRGENAQKAEYKAYGGDGLVIKPLLGHATLERVIAAGGAGNKGGHGLASYGGLKKLNMDGSTLTGGAVKKDKILLPNAAADGPAFVGGDAIFCRASPHQGIDISINNSTITGGGASPGAGELITVAGNGLKVMGMSNIMLKNASVTSGNNGRGADGINAGGGAITLIGSLVKSHGASAISVAGPTIISVDKTSNIDGGNKGGIGIKTRHESRVEISGTVKGGRYAVLFNGDNNALTLQNGVNLKGKIAAAGLNNRLNLQSINHDENSLDLGLISSINNQQGFTELNKLGEGNWMLNNNNIAVGGLDNVAVKQGSLTLAKTALLSAGEIVNSPAAFLGGSGTIKGKVKNAGTLYMGKRQNIAPFQTLTIAGDYHGEPGSFIQFNIRLEGDDSLTDKLVVRGRISGQSQLQINNLAGVGARTDQGILIIEAHHSEPSANTFSLSRPVVAGAYDYILKQEGNRWLLFTDLPGQPVSAPAATLTTATEQVDRSLPPPKPPRNMSNQGADENEQAGRSVPPPKPPRTFTHKGPEDVHTADVLLDLVKPQPLSATADDLDVTSIPFAAAALAETNQVFVAEVTNHDQGNNSTDILAETKRPYVSALTNPRLSSPDMEPSTERESSPMTAMDSDIDPLTTPDSETDTPPFIVSTRLAEDIDPHRQENPDTEEITDTENVAGSAIHGLDENQPSPFPQDTPDEEVLSPLAVTSIHAGGAPLRPEPGVYAANMAVANTLFVTGMHDRIGEPTYPGAIPSEESVYPAMWLRVVGGRHKSSMAGGQIGTQTDSQLAQLGGEILHIGGNRSDGMHIGLMAGVGQSRSRSRAALTGYQAGGGIEGYAVGLYGTWHQDQHRLQGPYLDLSLNYGWFENRVKGESPAEERYRSKGLIGSVETGYHRKIHEGAQVNAYLQPRLQVTWMGIRAAHTELNGDRFTLLGSGNIQSRLGNRFYLEKRIQGPNGRQQLFKPYIETNWVHNSRAFGVAINGSRLLQEGGRNLAEVKIGHEGQANRRVAVWGSLGYQAGASGFSNTVGTLGVKARF